MQQDIGQDRLSTCNIRARFDETLGRHIERLIGTRYGIGSLPLNVTTIPCLILAVERETDIESASSAPPERYTEETFLNELAEFGLNPDEDLKASLQDLIQKGYIDASPDSSFSAMKPAISMVRLVDRIFPKMPGVNLVAYLVQTMDEVLSGRKELKTAISQFDQTLQMQGVPLSKQKTTPKPKQTPAKIFRYRQEQTKSYVDTASPVLRGQDINRFSVQHFFSKGDEPPGHTTDKGADIEIEDSRSESEAPLEKTPDASSEPASYDHDLLEKTAQGESGPENMPSDYGLSSAVLEQAENETGLLADAEEAGEKPNQIEGISLTAATAAETDVISETHESATITDDIIESRIAAFTADLTTICPMCKNGEIQTQQTAKGNPFYTCSNKDCNLISWGKPYHIVCPQCKNPFLIETADSAGEITLKCPRATCRYRQNLAGETENAVPTWHESTKPSPPSPKPRRKVVRRRVLVRKKR